MPANDGSDPAVPTKKPVSERRRAHLTRAGQLGNERRRVFSGEDAAALARAYHLLAHLAEKYRLDDALAVSAEGDSRCPRNLVRPRV